MLPIQDVSNQVVFFDFQVEANRFYSDNSFSNIVSPGLGIRRAFSNENVLGLHVFSDYMKTNAKQNYWLLSPGVDFYHGPGYVALNGYIPVNNAPRKTGSDIAATDIGITEHQTFSGNSQYDYLIETFYRMRWGMDLTGGVLLGDKYEWEGKLGAYLYDTQSLAAIKGLRGEIDYYFNNHLALIIEDRYDNVFHNQTVVGIKINFIGTDNRGTVETQLKAPIYRNLNINTTSAGTAIGEYYQTNTQSRLIQNNMTFVSNESHLSNVQLIQSEAITGDGTFENPYTGLNQDILNKTTKNINIWVEGTGPDHPYTDATTLILKTGQSIYGRTNGFKLAASNISTQPTFSLAPSAGTAGVYIDNTNILENLIILGNGSDGSIGVQSRNVGADQTAILNGVTIGSTTADTGYTTALYNESGNVYINNATLYAIKETLILTASSIQPQTAGVFGIYNNGGTIRVTNSTVAANVNQVIYNPDTGALGGDVVGAFGVYNNRGTMTLSESTAQATSDNVADYRSPSPDQTTSIIGAFGLYNTKGTMTVTGSASSINATATGIDNVGNDGAGQSLLDYVGAFGAYNDGGGTGNTATLDIKQAHVTASATTSTASTVSPTFNDPAVTAVGVWNNGNVGTANTTLEQGANVDASAAWQITSTTSGGSAVNAYGLYNENVGSTGAGYLTTDGAIVTVTEEGGDGSGAGSVAGVINGALLSGIDNHGDAVTVISGATRITTTGTEQIMPVYGFYNYGSNNSTNGTSIEGSSIIDAEGQAGVSSAVYNSLGTVAIQGTADQNVTLIANGNNTNNGAWNDNSSTMTLNYVTIQVGSANGGFSLGINNIGDASSTTIQHVNVAVSSLSQFAFGVNNDLFSTVNITDSTFSVTTENGSAYGLWDNGGGMTFVSPTTLLYLNYDATPGGGRAAAFSSAGNYIGTTNVACYSNGSQSICPSF